MAEDVRKICGVPGEGLSSESADFPTNLETFPHPTFILSILGDSCVHVFSILAIQTTFTKGLRRHRVMILALAHFLRAALLSFDLFILLNSYSFSLSLSA